MWRPIFREEMLSIRRRGKFFEVVCRSIREADEVEKALVRALSKFRGGKIRRKT